MLFLVYPMMVKLCLSMLKCPFVGKKRYLMADLQEECFVGRHLTNVLMLTIPQFIIVVIGLPLTGLFIIVRSTSNERKMHDFHMRYGLLYLGYRDERSWWEIVIVVRKICVVSIATFGTLMGRVDVQIFLALGVVFLSIVLHLLGQPFDINTTKGQLLHLMEFSALSVAWCTFWGGLMFYILPGTEHDAAKIGMTILIVVANVAFLVLSFVRFVKEFIKDVKEKKEKQRKSQLNPNDTHIVPVVKVESKMVEDKADEDFNHETSKRHRQQHSMHSMETVAVAHEIHDNFHESEIALKAEHKKKQQRQRRNTQNRVLARLKIRNTKALHRVPLFASIPEYRLATAIEAILELTTYKKARQNEVLCRQGEQANDFYIIVSGQCGVTVRFEGTAEAVDRRVATLKELDFFGESALLGDNRNRNATVTVESESAQFLKLSRSHFESLVEENVINHDVVANMEQESERRIKATRRASHGAKELNFGELESPPPPPSPPPKQSQQSASGVAL